MKKFYSVIALLLMALSVSAVPVDQETALGEARAFLLRNVQGKAGMKLAPARLGLTLGQANDAFFVFNVGQEDGFVVVSGEDGTPAILGYADKGSFDAKTAPASVKSFLESYAEEIQWLRNHPQKAQSQALRAPRFVNIKRAITPLLQTAWNQDEPFNNNVPYFLKEENGRSLTGCVATAMAQIMKYYEWPAATKAEIPAYDCLSQFQGYDPIHVAAVPAGTKLDWANMLYYYYGVESDEENAAVATLMATAGAAVQADYRNEVNGGTSATNGMAMNALKTYFDYSPNCRILGRSGYLMDEWHEILYNELKEGRPVMMGGRSSGGGHAFVVDGYSSDDYFHINWGWGGYCNGYFLLSVANPGSTQGAGASSKPDGYSKEQEAIIGIEPNKGQTPMVMARMITDILSVSGNEMTSTYYSLVEGKNTFNVGIGYIKADGSIQPIEGYATVELDYYYGSSSNGWTFPVKGLADGTYKIMPVSKLASDTEWKYSLNPRMFYVQATVKGGEVSLQLIRPVIDFQVTKFSYNEVPTQARQLEVNVEIQNRADEYYGSLYLQLKEGDAQPSVFELGVTLPEKSTTTVTFFITPYKATTYDMYVTDALGTVYGQGKLEVAAAPSENPVVTVEDLVITNGEAPAEGERFGTVYGLMAGDVKLKNATSAEYNDKVCFYLQANDPITLDPVDAQYYYENVKVPAGSEVTVHFEFPYAAENYLQWPIILASDGNTPLRIDQNDIVMLLSGAVVYDLEDNCEGFKVDGTFTVPDWACTVDFDKVTNFTELKCNNPNVVYFFNADVEIPAAVQQNGIKGDVAKKLIITDGYPFHSPFSFEAEDVEYHRTLNPALDMDKGTGWETIVLPFDVTTIKCEDASIELREFSDESGANAIFKKVDAIEANIPYLIGNHGKPAQVVFKGQNVSFTADFAAVLTGDNLKMQGSLTEETLEGALTLNAEGTDFVKADGKVAPFRAVFLPTAAANVKYDKVHIAAEGVAVRDIQTASTDVQWYSIDGRSIQRPVKAGIYVRGGRKVVVK
jgi:hypothetical protein